jgi:pyridoxamine 5'-phosphate oxidase
VRLQASVEGHILMLAIGKKHFLRPFNRKMTTSVASLRKEYSEKGIRDDDAALSAGPFAFFKVWFDEACALGVVEPNAMCLATCKNNVPSNRFVLMKGFDDRGFVWYTNYSSQKGTELAENPHAAVTFWWGEIERSVRVQGLVTKVSDEESDAYFNCRPRGAQIGAWTSSQSQEISSREELEAQEKRIVARFQDESVPVPRPPHWGGFRIQPTSIEFWKGRQCRLHDRIRFERESPDAEWSRVRLQP